jgi:hypothetical protein
MGNVVNGLVIHLDDITNCFCDIAKDKTAFEEMNMIIHNCNVKQV